MAENTIKSRIQLKNDTEANWKKAVNFIPKKGEIIIYNIDESHDSPRIKIGDGAANVNDLVFLSSGSNFPTSEFIVSTNEESSAALTGTTKEATLENGKQIVYFTKFACPGEALTLALTLAGGTITEAYSIYNYDTAICDIAYPANCTIQMVYYNEAFYLINNNISIVI